MHKAIHGCRFRIYPVNSHAIRGTQNIDYQHIVKIKCGKKSHLISGNVSASVCYVPQLNSQKSAGPGPSTMHSTHLGGTLSGPGPRYVTSGIVVDRIVVVGLGLSCIWTRSHFTPWTWSRHYALQALGRHIRWTRSSTYYWTSSKYA